MSIIAAAIYGLIASSAFITDAFSSSPISGHRKLQLEAHEASSELLSLLSTNIDIGNAGQKSTDAIKSTISNLEASFLNSNMSNIDDESPSRFDPLIGLYEVKTVITENPKENPVGGKWTRSNGLAQKLFRTRAAFQHFLPFNSSGQSQLLHPEEAIVEAINIVSLDALDGLLRVTVVLRGDTVPLSIEERRRMNTNRTIAPLTNLAVRAFFDPPRIFLGRRLRRGGGEYSYLPLKVGPASSVVLDTTYCDGLVRIGRGGTSGTCFLFVSTNEEEAFEYSELMKLPSKKRSAIGKLGMIMAAS
ncbi:hypothetical protein ACHAW5_001701 [Stephanodiscus triporus]|uniref:Plastid lipid-associated protein/fibrillin conserved domain-containing protein n=1 Tax=Stephanodiscus triporus TaxID=2934178 RepID=A0ABD3MTL4_9STRA